jgi:hypothetical protein
MREASLDRGAEFLLLHIPYPRRHASPVERTLRSWSKKTGTHLVSMRDAFSSLSDTELEAMHQPHHWSPRGHQIVAEAIQDYVLERGLLD